VTLDRFRGCLLGLAVGDALGTTVEFRARGTFPLLDDIVGGGPFQLIAGQWTDDTSMALCLAASLTELRRFDARDQIERYWRWREHGYYSSTGRCFDIGSTVASALRRYRETGDPFAGSSDPLSAGNGCIMRLAPVAMFYFPDEAAATTYSGESSRTTHGAQECVEACRLFGGMICRALAGASKDDVLFGDTATGDRPPSIAAIARGDYVKRPEADVRSSGYVVESLEAALWCFTHTDDYASAVLRAANLGYDADTTAAVCGQLSGAFYGAGGIPMQWQAILAMRDQITALADDLYRAGAARPNNEGNDELARGDHR
jgi:ADP-ribosyl-[dinitrogen reductase] hydrolase